jgi:flavin reductase
LQGNGVIIETPISPDIFKQGMRQLAGGVCILATNSDGEWHGLTMTAVCSLTMDPPSLIACVNRDASAYGIISATRRVSVNVLSDDHIGLAALFSSSDVKGAARFDPQQWTRMASGVPALNEALATLDCEVTQETEVGQHSVLFCEVKKARLQTDRRPLVHFNREFCVVLPVQ